MNNTFTLSGAGWLAALLAASVSTAMAQAPTITGVAPAANAATAPRAGALTISFNQPLTAASAGALKVFSAQRGGQRTGATPATVNGNVLSFRPAPYNFRPGETVQYTVTTAAAGTAPLGQARVGQFTAATSGPGTGLFQTSTSIAVGPYAESVAVGDVDGDGDLDLLAASANLGTGGAGIVSVRLNNGRGIFTGMQNVSVGRGTNSVSLGDVDADGDLDFVTANFYSYTASVRLNDGSGLYGGTQEVAVGLGMGNFPGTAALADVDGDGDLDLLVTCGGNNGQVSVRLNDGTGTFGPGPNMPVDAGSLGLAVGDLDNDGDLDLVSCNNAAAGNVTVRLNVGNGTFVAAPNVAVGAQPYAVALADIDGDGDLDLATANASGLTASVRLNNGVGLFVGTQEVPVNATAVNAGSFALAFGDVDADGDPDLLVADTNHNTVSVRLNNGTGTFSGLQSVAVGTGPDGITLADVDGDSDLDLVTANNAGTASISLNGGSGPLAALTATQPGASLRAYPTPTTGPAAVAGAEPYALIAVFDALGRTLLSTRANAAGTASLNLPVGLAPGLYLVRAGTQVVRLTVE
jgi:plastocyanin